MRAVDHRQHLLLAGALAAAAFFGANTQDEVEIRTLADALYRRADWRWAQDGGETVSHGWTPERGFLTYRWEGYDEALLLYVLGLGSPTHPLPPTSYTAWTATFRWEHRYGYDYLYAGPLFIHQLSHVWIDLRGLQDPFMRRKGSDYFENSRRATYVQQRYAIENPRGFDGYGEHCWGLTASEGPGPSTAKLKAADAYGFKAAFNPTHPGSPGNAFGWWISPWHFGLNEGPVVLMIENEYSGLLWRLMRTCPHIRRGLQRAGFDGGWLTEFPQVSSPPV
jgi:hypothetical protein